MRLRRSGRPLGDEADLRRTSLRLGLQTGLLVVASLLVVGSLLFLLYERSTDAAADRLLVDATRHIDSADEAPAGVRVVVVTPHGRSTSTGMPAGFPDERQIAATARDGRTRQVPVVRGGDHYTVRTVKVGDRITQAVLDTHETTEQRGRVLTALLASGAVGVLLAVLLAAWLAHRTVRPMSQTIALQRRFVADASHELRTPLTLLSTRAQLLARRLRQDPGQSGSLVSDVEGVVADTRALTDVLDDLLAAADTGTPATREAVDLVVTSRECVDAASAKAQERGVVLAMTPAVEEDGTPAVVDGSPLSLRRAVTALLDNAIDHARSRVELDVRRSGRHVLLRVTDDGAGVPDPDASRLFERFHSTRDGRSGDGRRHYGLGLALVSDVAASHHGRVSVGPRPDGSPGAVFTVALLAASARRRPGTT